MRVLVTGAGGFLGRYIVEKLLHRGDQVRTFGRGDYPELRLLGAEIGQGDVRDAEAIAGACAGVDAIIHTAAVAGIWGEWKHFYGINTQGTLNVIGGCQRHGVRKLVFTSSPSVTFDAADQKFADETAPYPNRWLCHYPQTKALAEQAVLAAHGRHGLVTCALRPHLIWGPRDSHLVPRLIARARAGRLRRVGDGSNLIDMIYVENAADAHLQALDAMHPTSRVGGQAYFISQGVAVNCWGWIDELLGLAGLPPVRRSISTKNAWRLGVLLESAHRLLRRSSEPRMTRFLAAQLGTSHYFNIQKARDHFGFEPQVSTAEGMQRLANAWANG